MTKNFGWRSGKIDATSINIDGHKANVSGTIGLKVRQRSAETGATYNIHIDDESTGTTPALFIDTLRTGAALRIDGTATGAAFDIRNSVSLAATNFATTSTVGVIRVKIGGESTVYFIPVLSTYA